MWGLFYIFLKKVGGDCLVYVGGGCLVYVGGGWGLF